MDSVNRLKQRLVNHIKTEVFRQNVFEIDGLTFTPDIIITDVPYGNMVEWNEGNGNINQMMDA